jgi:hypothetical protein
MENKNKETGKFVPKKLWMKNEKIYLLKLIKAKRKSHQKIEV